MYHLNQSEYRQAFREAIKKGLHPSVAQQIAYWQATSGQILF